VRRAGARLFAWGDGRVLRVGDSRTVLRRLWFGLRSRMFGALVVTALLTLATAALALLAPLESALKTDSRKIGEGTVTVDRTELAGLPVRRNGEPLDGALDAKLEAFAHQNGATYVVWNDRLSRIDDTDRFDHKPQDRKAPAVVREALHPPRRVTTPYTLRGDVLVVAIRYRGQQFGSAKNGGRYFVLEMIQHVDAVTTADSVVRNAFLDAALVGLAVAIVLGVALSSRLLRRLRLLRDATLSVHGSDLGRQDEVPDEIGELARGFTAMHEHLRQQEQARRAFVATASHELRTPLTSLEGGLELLAEDLDARPVDLADARERVASARQQARRLSSLAKDLLDLSRLDAQLELRSEPVELGETARAVAAEFDQRAQARDVELALDEPNGSSWAQADPGSVARVVRILLDNALRFAPAHSTVTLSVRRLRNGTAIEVADEGPGVPLDERELIFERFRRGRNSGAESGFGLGLAIGSELAGRMGGSLELTGDGPGATFRLLLPRTTEPALDVTLSTSESA